MIYIQKFDIGDGIYRDINIVVTTKSDLELVKDILKRSYKTKTINFVTTSNPDGLPK